MFLVYPPNDLHDQQAHSYVADRKKTSAKPKISALQAELTASRTRLTLVEEKLRQITKELNTEMKLTDELCREKVARDKHRRQRVIDHFSSLQLSGPQPRRYWILMHRRQQGLLRHGAPPNILA